MDLGISEKVAPLLQRVRSFINEQVMPVEHEFVAEIEVDDPFVLTDRQMEILSSLKSQAREAWPALSTHRIEPSAQNGMSRGAGHGARISWGPHLKAPCGQIA